MLTVRPYRPEELPIILQRCMQSARDQLALREVPGATGEGMARQMRGMYQRALLVPHATILVAEWPPGAPGDGPAAHALLMPQANAFTGERELVVLDIWTHPALRGRRLGRLLLQQAEAYARAVGCLSLTAQVALHNRSSLRMFLGSGYQPERTILGKRL